MTERSDSDAGRSGPGLLETPSFDRAIDASVVWFNGRLIDQRKATVSVFTHALHYGSCVWEGVRCYETSAGPAMFRLIDHLRRLEASARAMRIPSPFSIQQLASAAGAVVARNRYRSDTAPATCGQCCGEVWAP